MSKNKIDKLVNRKARKFNKELEQDVFNNRFWVRQYQKARVDGLEYYLYELRDREQPERNRVIRGWLLGCSHFFMNDIFEEMNDFIIKSDFWEQYWREKRWSTI